MYIHYIMLLTSLSSDATFICTFPINFIINHGIEILTFYKNIILVELNILVFNNQMIF